MKRRTFLSLMGAAALTSGMMFTGCGAGSDGDDRKIVRIGHVQSQTHPDHLGLEAFANYINEKLGDKYRVEVYPSELLGSQTEMVQLTQTGAIDFVVASTAIMETFSAKYQIFNLPYLFSSVEAYHEAMDDPEVTDPIFKTTSKAGLETVAWLDAGTRNFYTIKTPINQPSDLKGLKIRVQQSPTNVEMMRLLPRDALHNGRAGNAAVVLRVIIIGKPVHVVPAVGGGGLCRQTAGTVHTAAGRAVADLRTQPQQGLLPQGGGILRHHQHHRMPGSKARQRQRGGKGAGGSFDDGLAGAQLLFLDGEGEHPLGKAVPGGAGGACKVQIGIQPSLQPAGGSIAAQLHDGAGAERLVKIGVDRHEDPPFMGYNNIILTQKDCARQDAF